MGITMPAEIGTNSVLKGLPKVQHGLQSSAPPTHGSDACSLNGNLVFDIYSCRLLLPQRQFEHKVRLDVDCHASSSKKIILVF